MEFMNHSFKDNTLYLYPPTRLDSANAPQTEAEINAIIDEHPGASLVFDFDGTEYVSSAGLRVFLRMRKMTSDLKIINVSNEVYEVFEMTGFTEMITIEKAFRKLSVEGYEVIGAGANGTVYRIDPETIVKVYNNPDALPDIRNEQALARRAFVLGIPTAISYDVVRVGEGYGSVFELLNAKSIAQLIQKDPEHLDEHVAMCSDLLKIIHSTTIKPDEMPSMKEVALDWSRFLHPYLPEDAGKRLTALIDAVPEDMHLMHGDYHIKNVMVQNGEALLIDMDTLCHGHPVFEFASMYNAYCGFGETQPGQSWEFFGIAPEISVAIWKKSLRMYFDTADEAELSRIEDKARLVGYTRLMRRTIRRAGLESEEGRRKVDYYRQGILKLLETVDSLTF